MQKNFIFTFNLQQLTLLFLFVIAHFNIINLYSTEKEIENDFQLGIDNFIENTPTELIGKNIIILANQASRTKDNISTIDALKSSKKVNISYILVPEHGYFTSVPAGDPVENDSINGIPLISLYGKSKTPSKTLLSQSDAILIDIQDIGVRSYTFISTVYNLLAVAAELGKNVYILDRPNPLGGIIVDGNLLDPKFKSFVGMLPVTYLHGCTIGELCNMLNEQNWLETKEGNKVKCEIKVIKMSNWERWKTWEDLDLNWIPTSPHIPTVNAIKGAAVLGTIGELGVISIGIGTTLPFQYLGGPTFDYDKFSENLGGSTANNQSINDYGVDAIKVKYRPFYGLYSGKNINGVLLNFINTNQLLPYSYGVEILNYLKINNFDIFPTDRKKYEMFNKVNGSDIYTKFIFGEITLKEIKKIINNDKKTYLELRKKYLLY